MTPVDALFDLLQHKGTARYGREAVSQYEHAVQCAMLAEKAGAPASLIAAALLHDIGHLIADDEAQYEDGVDRCHERVAERYLSRWFGEDVIQPIALHVEAKRYLCSANAGYNDQVLSSASQQSLRLQGGPFTAEQASAFLRQPFARQALRLRAWDDRAKVSGRPLPSLENYRPVVVAALRRPASR